MKIQHVYLVLTCAFATVLPACGGDAPPPETPAQPAGDAAGAPPPAAGSGQAAATPPPAEPPKAPEKPAKEKIVGKWQFDLAGSDPGKKAEEDAKKKAGTDEKKLAALLKPLQDSAAKEWIEFSADTYTSYVGDKAIFQMKYEVAKEEGNTVYQKPVGKDLISKKDVPQPKDPIAVTVVDDSTIQMKDPKKGLLQFKRK
jgi:hypothetical protein